VAPGRGTSYESETFPVTLISLARIPEPHNIKTLNKIFPICLFFDLSFLKVSRFNKCCSEKNYILTTSTTKPSGIATRKGFNKGKRIK